MLNQLLLDKIAEIMLLFSHDTIILPLLICGFIGCKRKNFYHATCLILLSIIFNSALKASFKIPLSAALNSDGFAFPSGHMQSSTVLYSWIAYRSQSLLLRLFIILLLSGIGFSLIYKGYHNIGDIGGALFFALLLVGSYALWCKKSTQASTGLSLFVATGALLYLSIVYSGPISYHVWKAYYTLLGFVGMVKIVGLRLDAPQCLVAKMLATALCFIILFVIQTLRMPYCISHLPVFLRALEGLVIGCTIPAAAAIVNSLMSKAKLQSKSAS